MPAVVARGLCVRPLWESCRVDQVEPAKSGSFHSLLRAERADSGTETAGVHKFLDHKPAAGDDAEVRSEGVDSANGTVSSLGRRPPARPQIPKTSVTLSSARAAD